MSRLCQEEFSENLALGRKEFSKILTVFHMWSIGERANVVNSGLMFPSTARFCPPWKPTETRGEEGHDRGLHPALPDGQRAPAVPVVLHSKCSSSKCSTCNNTRHLQNSTPVFQPGTAAPAFPAEGSDILLVVKLLKSSKKRCKIPPRVSSGTEISRRVHIRFVCYLAICYITG